MIRTHSLHLLVMTITLTPEERENFITQARREFVAEMIRKHTGDFDLISRAQAAGILDVTPNTLANIKGLVRVELIEKNVIKYRLSQIVALIKGKEVKQ